jgi:hypothetical protein
MGFHWLQIHKVKPDVLNKEALHLSSLTYVSKYLNICIIHVCRHNCYFLCVYYRFPVSDPDRLHKWVLATKRDKWVPKATDYLCSKHFDDSCFYHYSTQLRLREDAIPTIFDFPEHLQKAVKPQRRTVMKHSHEPQQQDAQHHEPCVSAEATSTSSEIVSMNHHNYFIEESPRGIKRRYDELLDTEIKKRQLFSKRIKVMRRNISRKHSKMISVKEIIAKLKCRNDINHEAVSLIEQCFGSIPADMLRKKLYGCKTSAYTEQLRSFAMTLHFYSAKAYDFVRRSFRMALPHPQTLRKWCSAVEGKPGFTAEAFQVCNCINLDFVIIHL